MLITRDDGTQVTAAAEAESWTPGEVVAATYLEHPAYGWKPHSVFVGRLVDGAWRCDEYDFDYSAHDSTTYYHCSGGGGKPYIHALTGADGAPGRIWLDACGSHLLIDVDLMAEILDGLDVTERLESFTCDNDECGADVTAAVRRLPKPADVIDLAARRHTPGTVWHVSTVQCIACGYQHVATKPMPEWAAAPVSCACPECGGAHTCLPMHSPPERCNDGSATPWKEPEDP